MSYQTTKRRKLVTLSLTKCEARTMHVTRKIYELGEIIGRGSTGTVLEAKSMSVPTKNSLLSVKLFKDGYGRSDDTIDLVMNEINILNKISHPNIIKLHDILLVRTKEGKTHVQGLVFDCCDMGDLYSYLRVSTGFALSSDFIQCVFQQLVRAVSHLHSLDIVHNDIKPENILFKSNGLVVLTDFGFAQEVKAKEKISEIISATSSISASSGSDIDTENRMKTSKSVSCFNTIEFIKLGDPTISSFPKSKSLTRLSSLSKELPVLSCGGTPAYRAPETMKNETKEFDGAAADLWGLGVVLHVMVYSRFPKKGDLKVDVKTKRGLNLFGNLKKDSWGLSFDNLSQAPTRSISQVSMLSEGKSGAVVRVIQRLLEEDPQKRVSTVELIYDPWVTAFDLQGSVRIVKGELKALQYYRK